ncbi:hypothetical protein [Paenibacillus ihuae]|uniref:hypothetical protein n=1 Tax=Paenibacillus ihuae TaxID=1232431 RepID=UPI001ADF3F3E
MSLGIVMQLCWSGLKVLFLPCKEENASQIVFALGDRLAELHRFSRESVHPELSRRVYTVLSG